MRPILLFFLYFLAWLLAWWLLSTIINVGLINSGSYNSGDNGEKITYLLTGVMSTFGSLSMFGEVFNDLGSDKNK